MMKLRKILCSLFDLVTKEANLTAVQYWHDKHNKMVCKYIDLKSNNDKLQIEYDKLLAKYEDLDKEYVKD